MFKINLKLFFQSLLIFILLHIPILFISNFIFLNRAIFNLDYIFAILVAPINLYFSLFILLISVLIEVLISGYFLFNFQNLDDLFYSITFLTKTNFISLFNIFVFFVLILSIIIFFFSLKLIKKNKLKYFFFISLTLFILDYLNSTNFLSPNSKVKFNLNLSGSNFLTIAHYLINKEETNNVVKNIEKLKEPQIININNEINRLESDKEFSLILIILESFGVSSNRYLNNELNKILSSYKNEINIYTSKSLRYGHTMQGEVQIFCNILIENTQSLKNFDFSKYKCLPNELKKRKIFTAAYHGFSSNFFNRDHWWKNIGFEELYFFNDLKKLKNKCGSFLVGKCDSEMIKEVFEKANTKKGFYYLLTLNTHYPYMPNINDDIFIKKCLSQNIEDAVCSLVQIYRHNLKIILEEFKNSDKKIKIIITGDHKPPFLKKEEIIFFTKNEVPNIILEKK